MRRDNPKANPNKQLLDEVNRSDGWFWAKKKRPVWAKKAERRELIDTLEGSAQMKKGDYLCRGDVGEFWPQPEAEFLDKYEATKIVDGDGFRLYVPSRTQLGVMAAKVRRAFLVRTRHGTFNGRAGDFVLKPYRDRHVQYPDSLYIVAADVFHQTYRMIPQKDPS